MPSAESAAGAVELWLVVQPARGDEREVVLEASSGASVADAAEALAEEVGWEGARPALFSRRLQAWLDDDVAIAAAGVSTGDVLVLGRRGDTSDWSPQASRHLRLDLVQLSVVGGPASGLRIGLRQGETVIGREPPDGGVALDDPSLSRSHLVVRVDEGVVTVSDAGSRNGTAVEGVVLAPGEARRLADGEVVEAGRSLLAFAPTAATGTSVSGVFVAQHGGRVPFNRPPRVSVPFEPAVVDLGSPPEEARKGRLPLAASLLPLVVGVVLWQTSGNLSMLLFAAMTPVMAGWTFVEDRRSGKRRFRDEAKDFRARVSAAADTLQAAGRREREERRRAAPGAAELLERVTDYAPSLWERRPEDSDFLSLRIGSGEQEIRSRAVIGDRGSAALREEAAQALAGHTTVASVPVAVSLPRVGALGVSGPGERFQPLARWLLMQAAVLHSPRDLVIAAAVPASEIAAWSWLKWLPHTHSEVSPIEGTHLASSGPEVRRLLEEVRDIAQERRRSQERAAGGGAPPLPWILLLLDERVQPERAVLTEILSGAAATGIAAVWVGERSRNIPGECGAIVELAANTAALTLTVATTGDSVADVTADGIPVEVATEAALALAPVRDTSAGRGRGQVPRRVSLLDLLSFDPGSTVIRDRWQRGTGLEAVIGASADGPLAIDLRHDGPHALVAGTTGAGKSELLQTVVASLAAAHPPTRITFLLVDYKGGAAFKECVNLPHTVGFVTDLDEHLTARALLSLNAELRRREEILRVAGAKDLRDLERRGDGAAPPSLVIVIDEFATLAKEVPDFVAGVVDVAQRGRSLGVHLILATQRPGGVVSENIRANTNLRIALRVNDPGESSDVIDDPQAARVPRGVPGRGYVRMGHGELTEFQAAYVGGASGVTTAKLVTVRPLGFDTRSSTQERVLPPTDERRTSDLLRIVAACREAARELALPAPVTPWLPALPDVLPLRELAASDRQSIVVGLLDEPARQSQVPYALDLEEAGSVLVFGASGSGKTTLLRTAACALADATSPEEAQIYGLDFASRGLLPLEALPHCGSVVPGEDEERVTRLFSMLRREVATRRDRFGRAGVSSLLDYERSTGESLPRLVVLLDDYGGFVSAYERVNLGELVETLPRLVSDGRPLGLHFLITADRRAAVPGSVTGVVSQKIVLRMATEDDYGSLGIDVRSVRGAVVPAGRAFVGTGLEMHTAVVGGSGDAPEQAQAIAELGRRLEARGATRAPAVRVLPPVIPLAGLERDPDRHGALLGIGDADLRPVVVDVSDSHFLVTGSYRTGRSTALATVAQGLLAEREGWLLTPRRSPLRDVSGWSRVASGPEECERLAKEAAERAGDGTPLVIVVDDADQLADGNVSTQLEATVRRGRDGDLRVVAGGETQAIARAFSSWLRELRKDEHGLLLNPQLEIDGDLFGVRLPRRALPSLPGRGYLVSRGTVELVQVALPSVG